jgi:hypothetical protein
LPISSFEFGIKGQKRLEQVLLGPKAKLAQYPIAPIIEKKENVVPAQGPVQNMRRIILVARKTGMSTGSVWPRSHWSTEKK